MAPGKCPQSKVLISPAKADQQWESILKGGMLPTPASKEFPHQGAHETAVIPESVLCVGQNPGVPCPHRPRAFSGTPLPPGACWTRAGGLHLIVIRSILTIMTAVA